MPNVKILFVEDYTKMSKEEFAEYIKKIYNEGYTDGYEAGSHTPTINLPYTKEMWEPTYKEMWTTTCTDPALTKISPTQTN